jgi:translation initiation factor IF-3
MITALTVRVVSEEGEQLGVMTRAEAALLASERELDLVLISPKAEPPVCKLIDYDKFRYQKGKKEQKSQKRQKKVELKELRLRPNISSNDLMVKVRRAREFLLDGDKVKFNLQFVGRENLHMDLGLQILKKVVEDLLDVAVVEQETKRERRAIQVTLAPAKTIVPPKTA